MKKIIGLIFLLSIVLSTINMAQDAKINAQIRPRFELNDKDFNSNTSAPTSTFLRTRLGVTFTPTTDIMGFVQLQDSRVFGTEPNTLSSIANVDVHQAYFKIDKLFKLPVSVKAGRMELSYGNQRLIGAVGWHNVGRSFDGLVAGVKLGKVNVDILALQTVERGLAGDSLDQPIYAAYFDLLLNSKYKIQPFAIHEEVVKNDNASRTTLGLYIKGNINNFWHEIEAAYQLGKANANQDIAAYMFAANFGMKFTGKYKPWVSVGIDYLSGDDGADADKYKVFNTLYATNHKFYGYMDYFLNIPANTYGRGLMDLHAKVGASFSKKFSAGVNFHMFNSTADYILLNGNTATDFGIETDLTLKYKYNKAADFTVGYSFFSPGEIFKETRGKDLASWAYIMAVINL